MRGSLPLEADYMLEAAPAAPFDWVREGTSFWLYEENGAFGIPRIGVEAEPWTWTNRRFQSNFAFADGRVLVKSGKGPMPPIFDEQGKPAILGGGPITFQCIRPFERWLVRFDGLVIDTHVSNQIAQSVDQSRTVPLKYEFELTMAVPPNEQDISPKNFFSWGKGKQRDAVSVGLGWRFEQMLRGEGELHVDGTRRSARVVGSRVKRRSVRTDGLMLRGHCWQAVVFPDGRAAGFEARPVHEDGFEAWNEGFVYQGGRLYPAKATKIPWLGKLLERGDDVSFDLEYERGTARIEGVTELSTFQVSRDHLWGLKLQQSGARYTWDGTSAYGMIERSSFTAN
jgi:prepilin-type processing-associated H-X9-DG protein